MVSNNTPLVGLVGIILVVAVIAIVAGLAISGTDLLNYNTSAAAARAKDWETQTKLQRDAVDLEAYRAEKAAQIEKGVVDLANYKAIQAARTQAEQEKLRLEAQARQIELEQTLAQQRARGELDLALARLTRYVEMAVGGTATLIMSGGLAVLLILLGRSRFVSAKARAQAKQTGPWRNPVWRTEQIRGARMIEAVERESALVWRAAHRSIIGGNGKHPPKDEPAKVAGWQAV